MDSAPEIEVLKNRDPILAQAIARIGQCQLYQNPPQGDLFFCLSRSIIHQQLSTKVAQTIHHRFLQLYPDPQVPLAEQVGNTPDEVLRAVGISRPKISYLKDLARQAIDSLPPIEELSQMEDEAIIETLTQVKGIGRWSAQMLLIFRLQRPDVFPIDDLGIRTAIKQLYGLETLPDRATTASYGQKWTPYTSIASWYLWQSLKLKSIG
ncbi:DNA-3-methyladenine glycosylase family protein [Merismopedia glauca]|uniref:DNA-3-methyladenine glycosylase II n=1 Tax=Merismopedia glauca CCAP 1448/3 TaxID=1296344 RepID=A0A2T1BXX9_9CYAN|nr:DNA-3-methyladenine glycosylase [Merismopedia glauca]PSB00870.1 DNA-3-methyladenine glycosylase 2 family protein [Merismopedia glauca CCAP 1448/3]